MANYCALHLKGESMNLKTVQILMCICGTVGSLSSLKTQ